MLKYVVIREKGLSGRIGTFSGPILEQIGTLVVIFIEMLKNLKIAYSTKKYSTTTVGLFLFSDILSSLFMGHFCSLVTFWRQINKF